MCTTYRSPCSSWVQSATVCHRFYLSELTMLKRFSLPLSSLLLVSVLAACSTQPQDDLGNLPTAKYDQAEKNLELAKKRKGEQAVGLYLAAVDQAWQAGDAIQARSLLEAADLADASPAQLMFAHTLAA